MADVVGGRDREEVAAGWREFGERQAPGKSPSYARICVAVAEDEEMLEFLLSQPRRARQPNLVLAAVRYLFGAQDEAAEFRRCVLDNRGAVEAVLRSRRTQTNEPGRCAALLPALARLPQPLALLEVGAAGERGSTSRRLIRPRPTTAAGSSRSVWPEESDRLERLGGALALAASDPPPVHRGDLVEGVEALAAQAPAGAHLVVFHTAVLVYLEPARRRDFARAVERTGASWLSCERPGVVELEGSGEPLDDEASFELGLDGRRIAACDPHGRWLRWAPEQPASGE